ncbi:MAG: ABC transporter permease subunit [Planctomycetaceae bacterium]|nr:ABC transporter permease subunit [Planctomycetaceae bacterium]
MFRRLLWKEWRENQWKLVFGSAVSLAFTALLFRIRLFPDSANCTIISFAQMLIVPVIYALDIFSGEIANRTIHLLFKFPVPRWKIFLSKYLVCIAAISLIFLLTGALMEIMGHGREADTGFLLKYNAAFGAAALLLFTWFCGFGAQSRSEAGSLVAMFGVMIGWAIVFFWAFVCEQLWAIVFVPYFLPFIMPQLAMNLPVRQWLHISSGTTTVMLAIPHVLGLLLILCIACYRFVKVRRYL